VQTALSAASNTSSVLLLLVCSNVNSLNKAVNLSSSIRPCLFLATPRICPCYVRSERGTKILHRNTETIRKCFVLRAILRSPASFCIKTHKSQGGVEGIVMLCIFSKANKDRTCYMHIINLFYARDLKRLQL
jgi:hypothetical protein